MDPRHPDYSFFHIHRFSGYVLASDAEALQDTLVRRTHCTPVPGAGRGGLYRFKSNFGDSYLRVYKRGGVIRHFIEESYLLDNRPLAEFRLHTHLAAAGFPVPLLLGVVWHKVGPMYRGAIATLALQGETLLAACIQSAPPENAVLAACGALIQRMHNTGVFHADLNASNIFLSADGPYLLDFDRAKLRDAPLTTPLRRANLARLHRSLKKHGVPDSVFEALKSGYKGLA